MSSLYIFVFITDFCTYVFKVHLSCDIDQYFLPVKWIIFHCIDIPCFISPLIIWWVVQLFNLYFTSALNNGPIHICGQGLCKDKYIVFGCMIRSGLVMLFDNSIRYSTFRKICRLFCFLQDSYIFFIFSLILWRFPVSSHSYYSVILFYVLTMLTSSICLFVFLSVCLSIYNMYTYTVYIHMDIYTHTYIHTVYI